MDSGEEQTMLKNNIELTAFSRCYSRAFWASQFGKILPWINKKTNTQDYFWRDTV